MVQSYACKHAMDAPSLLILFLLLGLFGSQVFVLDVVVVPYTAFPVLLQHLLILLADGDAFDAFDFLPFDKHNDSADSGNDTSECDKETCGPTGTVVAVQPPHKPRQDALQEGVPYHQPYDSIHSCNSSWWSSDSCQGSIGDFVWGKRAGQRRAEMGRGGYIMGPYLRVKLIRSWKTKPSSMNACQASKGDFLLLDAILEKEIQIAKAPRGESKTCDTKEGVKDLRIPLYPFASGRVDVIASGNAHCR